MIWAEGIRLPSECCPFISSDNIICLRLCCFTSLFLELSAPRVRFTNVIGQGKEEAFPDWACSLLISCISLHCSTWDSLFYYSSKGVGFLDQVGYISFYCLRSPSLGFFFVLFGLWSRLSTTFHLFDIALVCINEMRLSVELGFGVVLFLT